MEAEIGANKERISVCLHICTDSIYTQTPKTCTRRHTPHTQAPRSTAWGSAPQPPVWPRPRRSPGPDRPPTGSSAQPTAPALPLGPSSRSYRPRSRPPRLLTARPSAAATGATTASPHPARPAPFRPGRKACRELESGRLPTRGRRRRGGGASRGRPMGENHAPSKTRGGERSRSAGFGKGVASLWTHPRRPGLVRLGCHSRCAPPPTGPQGG